MAVSRRVVCAYARSLAHPVVGGEVATLQHGQDSAPDGVLLALDLGSTWLKVAAVAPDGSLIAGARAPVQTDARAREGAREQSPVDWWSQSVRLVRTLLDDARLSPQRILGLSATGRGANPVFLDVGGEPVTPVWLDGRSLADERRARELAVDLGLPPGAYAVRLAGRLAWLRDERPAVFGRIHTAMHAKDYLVYRLTGEAVTDPASGPDADRWPGDLFEALAVAGVRLPAVRPGWTVAGGLTEKSAEELGLPAGLPVAVGVHDGVAANIGAGAVQVGESALTLGTHAVIRGVVEQPAPGARRFYELLPGRVCVGGNALYGGRSVDWLLRSTGDAGDVERRLAQLDGAAQAVPPGSGGTVFLPFLGGTVSPQVRPFARAAFAGLGLEADRAILYRAVLEGVAYALRGIRDELAGWDVRPRELRLSGGGARSHLWRSILADVLETPIVPTQDHAEGRGAAACLAIAIGCYADVDQAVGAMVRPEPAVTPDPRRVERYAEGYGRYRRIADALYEAEQPA